jgi:hypothetical protein
MNERNNIVASNPILPAAIKMKNFRQIVNVAFGSFAAPHNQHIIAAERLELRAFRTLERQTICLHPKENGDR